MNTICFGMSFKTNHASGHLQYGICTNGAFLEEVLLAKDTQQRESKIHLPYDSNRVKGTISASHT